MLSDIDKTKYNDDINVNTPNILDPFDTRITYLDNSHRISWINSDLSQEPELDLHNLWINQNQSSNSIYDNETVENSNELNLIQM